MKTVFEGTCNYKAKVNGDITISSTHILTARD
jgi:hypothetical protein